jgi:hypothetical protein
VATVHSGHNQQIWFHTENPQFVIAAMYNVRARISFLFRDNHGSQTRIQENKIAESENRSSFLKGGLESNFVTSFPAQNLNVFWFLSGNFICLMIFVVFHLFPMLFPHLQTVAT